MDETMPPTEGLTLSVMTGGDQIALRRALEVVEKMVGAYGARAVDLAMEDGGFVFRLQVSPTVT